MSEPPSSRPAATPAPVRAMRHGRTAAETAALNGWAVGTLVRGHEMWSDGVGVWSTWRITAIGEDSVLVRGVRRDFTHRGADRPTDWRRGVEHTATFTDRDWFEVSSADIDPPVFDIDPTLPTT